MRDPDVADILVNTSQQVYVERLGKLEHTPVIFRDDAHLLQIIDRIVSRVGRRVDESSPMVDARLPGRVARERHHSAVGARWADCIDPAIRSQPADDRRSLTPRVGDDAGECGRPGSIQRSTGVHGLTGDHPVVRNDRQRFLADRGTRLPAA